MPVVVALGAVVAAWAMLMLRLLLRHLRLDRGHVEALRLLDEVVERLAR